MKRVSLSCLFAFLFFACTNTVDPVSEGGSGTEAGEAYGMVLDSAGQPAASVTLQVYRQSFIMETPELVDSVRTDEDGNFRIAASEGLYYLQAATASGLAWASRVVLDSGQSLDVGAIQASSLVDLSGVLGSISGEFPTELRLEGTPYVCTLNATSAGWADFNCDSVPAGNFELIADGVWLRHLDLTGLDGELNLDTLYYNPEVLTLESWPEVGEGLPQSRYHDLVGLFGGKGWYMKTYGVAEIEPESTYVMEHSIKFDSLASRGYFDVNYTLDSATSGSWVEIGLVVGNDLYDFSTLDSLCITDRGDANTLQIGLGRYYSGQFRNVWLDVEIGSEEDWGRACYAVDDWFADDPAEEFSTIMPKLNRIRFRLGGGSFWHLSNVELTGLDLPSVFQ